MAPKTSAIDGPQPAALATAAESAASSSDRARLGEYVFPEDPEAVEACSKEPVEHRYVGCLLGLRFAEDEEALELARRLYLRSGIVAGVETGFVIDDGDYRGRVEIEPALPVGEHRRHLELLLDAFDSIGSTIDAIKRRAAAPVRFVAKPRAIRFYVTTNATAPSAYADDDVISYNVRGELWTSSDSVFETLVHELFHLSDEERGDWSEKALLAQYEDIRQRCATSPDCLEPFAPHDTKVDGGIYYAFHPANDVREYAAELAIRYVREQRLRLSSTEPPADDDRFKCRATENAIVWREMSETFFGGFDLVPPC